VKATASPSLDACDIARLVCFAAASVTTSRRACLLASSARFIEAPRSPDDASHRAVLTAGVTNPDCADAVAPDATDHIRRPETVFIIDTSASPLTWM
jgi:hypothetical protein